MAKLVLDCVTVSEIGVGGHSYGQDPVVGVQLVTGVGRYIVIEVRVRCTASVVFPPPEQDQLQHCNTTQVSEQKPVLDVFPGQVDSSTTDPTLQVLGTRAVAATVLRDKTVVGHEFLKV